ncbi:MAG: long-chain fatty acid--CoA ligase [Acidobacteriota bacterium]
MTLPPTESDTAPDAVLRTLADLPFHVMGRFPKPLSVGRCRGDHVDGVSSQQLFERTRDLSLGLRALGIAAGDRVAIIAESRPEWILCDLAILAAGAVTVPIYPTLSAAQARYILQDSGARVAIVSTRLQLGKLQEVRHLLAALEAVVVMDPAATEPAVPAGPAASALTLDELEQRGHARMTGEWGAGRGFREAARSVDPDDLATIIYTSGTTGEPKGVMLTHANLVANLRSTAQVLDVSQEDVALSFLPLSHGFERMVSFVYLFTGVTIIFAESFETLGRDMAQVRPTVFTGVPRVFEKLQARILDAGHKETGIKAALFQWSVNAGRARSRTLLQGNTPGPIASMKASIADRLVFSKIRAKLGGRIRFVASGSAPLDGTVMEFFHAAGVRIMEGYGLTETSPILTVNPLAALRAGSVGRAIPDVELRIAADGEILARGPNIMRGYYNQPEATADVLKDGWFHTGDIGTVDAGGYLRITDRKKDLLVTSGGKKIAPQPIEALLKRSPLVSEAVLLGDRRKYAAALIVPEFAALERRLQGLNRPPAASRDELVTRADVIALYQEIVDALNLELSQFERIKQIALLKSEFTADSGELTPTMKVKRKVVEQKYAGEIAALYPD